MHVDACVAKEAAKRRLSLSDWLVTDDELLRDVTEQLRSCTQEEQAAWLLSGKAGQRCQLSSLSDSRAVAVPADSQTTRASAPPGGRPSGVPDRTAASCTAPNAVSAPCYVRGRLSCAECWARRGSGSLLQHGGKPPGGAIVHVPPAGSSELSASWRDCS